MAVGRSLAVVLIGVIVGGGIIFLVEMVGSSMYPPPADVDMSDIAQAREAVRDMPVGAMLMVLLGWSLGALAGGGLAATLARSAPDLHALAVGVILLLLAAINMVLLPHPVWMWLAALVAVPGSAWLGSRMFTRPARRVDRGIA